MSNQFCTQCGERLEPAARFCTACGTAVARATATKASRQPAKMRRPIPWLPLILVIGSGLIALGFLLYQANPPSVVDVPDEHNDSGLPYPDVPRISVAETRERFENGTAVIVDVRNAQEYAEAHIPDALSIPLDDLQTRYQELPRSAEIVTYCT